MSSRGSHIADGGRIRCMNLQDATLIFLASEKGILRAMARKHSATAYEAIIMPICTEVGRQRPIPPRRRPGQAGYVDPLTAPVR